MGLFQSRFIRLPKHKTFDFHPLYYNPEEEIKKERERQTEERRIKLERGSFFNSKHKSRLVGAFSDKDLLFQDRYNSSGSQFKRILLLVAMLSLPLLHIGGYINGIVTFGFLAILVLVFVIQVNKF